METGIPTDVIHRLSNHVINLIAAGEVVERPASVVKELVENSIDAGATRVDIRLGDGGIRSISVIDDGRGMQKGNLGLCIERHATSKVEDAQSLEAIETFGFRGEAVSSIASVSRLEIRSRRRGEGFGHRVRVEFGRMDGEPEIIGLPEGTAVIVSDLFELVPARQKFLRSVSTEFAHCQRVVRELALGNPGVQFFISHNEGEPKSYVTSGRKARVTECLRVDWEPLMVREENEGMALEAYLSPGHIISDRGDLSLFVNGRAVRNRNLLSAVRRGYLETVGPHHDPTGVVYIDIAHDRVDVNVHPQKTEVRILKSESLYSWIIAAIRKALARIPAAVTEAAIPAWPDSNRAVWNRFEYPTRRAPEPMLHVAEPSLPWTTVPEPLSMPLPLSNDESPLRYLGQVKDSYLICEDPEGLLMVDQHALHEKFRFEELMRHSESGAALGQLPSQRLLLPKVVRLSSDLVAIFESSRPLLARLGMDVEWLGSEDVAIRTIPEPLSETEAERVLVETLRLILDEGAPGDEMSDGGLGRMMRSYVATVACHSVVRANQRLSDTEARELLGLLKNLEMGWTCPHGRPVLFRMSFGEMARYFQRT